MSTSAAIAQQAPVIQNPGVVRQATPPRVPQTGNGAPAPILPADSARQTAPILRSRPIIQDGDLSFPREPQPVRDGVINLQTPVAPTDGASPAEFDQRTAADIAVFNNPPAGYDPQLFQIDDLSPDLDRRPRRLFIQQVAPYDPVGMRIGSFILFPEIEIGSSFVSNALSSPDDTPDRSFDITPSARL
ncbi:MAG: outer membrane beta-barrel protein, partial [Pseudomonadota bacterium]